MRLQFHITGMTCAACQARVERAARQVPGVQRAHVNLLLNTLTVEGAAGLTAEPVIQAVTKAGYGIVLADSAPRVRLPQDDAAPKQLKKRFLYSLLWLCPLWVLSMGPMLGLPLKIPPAVSLAVQLVLTLAVCWLNRAFFVQGFKHVRAGSPNMDSLVALGSGAAVLSGIIGLCWPQFSASVYFESAAMILTLVTLGKWLEARAKAQTTGAVFSLVVLFPTQASVRRESKEEVLAPSALRVGDILLWRAGTRAAADGVVIAGSGAADESAVTGESVAQEKLPGSFVTAGTLLVSGYVEVRVARAGQDTTLSKMIQLVEQAAGEKAPVARLADRVSAVFVPTVLGIALITFAVWCVAGFTLSQAVTAAISVLVISCPCALGLATPTAIMVGTGQAARNGILIKSAEILEKAHHINAVILDKTGTVTTGKMQVARVCPACVSPEELLRWAASLEQFSDHPFALALRTYPAEKQPLLPAVQFQTIPGRGVQAVVAGDRLVGGNLEFMRERGVPLSPEVQAVPARAAAQGCTPLFFARGAELLGHIWFSDTLKPTAQEAVALLKSLGIKVLLVTGDNAQTAAHMAARLGISDVKAGVFPHEKEALVRQLQAGAYHVAMVGDGINDAPALARANVGIALGAGTDVAVESADMVLMQEDVRSVAGAVLISRAVFRIIKQNLFWAFFYNVIGIMLAAGVFYPLFGWQLSPVFAAAAMSLSSVCVVTNALRLRFFKLPYRAVSEEPKIMKKTLIIEGMMCGHCAAHVERALNAIAGVQAKVDLQRKAAVVQAAQEVQDAVLRQAVQNAGYEVVAIQ